MWIEYISFENKDVNRKFYFFSLAIRGHHFGVFLWLKLNFE